MEKELRAGWFDPDSIEHTVKSVLQSADLSYLAQVPPSELARLLVNEIHFLGPYTPQEERAVAEYVYGNLNELCYFVQALAQQQHAV